MKKIYYNTFIKKFLGLMFSNPKNKLLIITLKKESRINASIHTLFVFYPIDVIWLNKNKVVVDIKRNIKPFCFNIAPKVPSKYILETKAGNSKNIKIGQRIKIG
jgi:uncharacterized membrane protein (UPF0127 family)